MSGTRIHAVLRFRAADLDPAEITRVTGVEPTRTFAVGEARGASRSLAGWDWTSSVAADAESVFDEVLDHFAPHASALRSALSPTATVSLSVVGTVAGLVVSSPEQAEQRRIDWGADGGEPFTPFFDGDPAALYLAPEVVAFLASIQASVDTHIDFELDEQHPNWWERTK